MPATSEILNRPCVSEEMAKLAHHRYVQSDLRAAFLDGVRAEMARNQWQPIETAPRDGTTVLLWIDWVDGPDVEVGYFRNGSWRQASSVRWMPLATHWMPVPAGPARAEANHAR